MTWPVKVTFCIQLVTLGLKTAEVLSLFIYNELQFLDLLDIVRAKAFSFRIIDFHLKAKID
jgi:hypothetical protein